MSTEAAMAAMVDFVSRRLARQRDGIDADTPLISSGLIDSFAMVDVLVQLETVTARRISPGRIAPRDLETVRQMVTTAEQVGVLRS